MSNWLKDRIALLLTEDGKLVDILASLTFFQCVSFFFIFMLVIRLSNKADKETR